MERAPGRDPASDRRPPVPSSVPMPAGLHARVRDALSNVACAESRPSRSWERTHTRITVALLLVPVLTALVAITASQLVYDHPAAGLAMAVQSGSALPWTFIATLALACGATSIAVLRGASGFGSSVVALALVAIVVAPLYAALALPAPVHTHELSAWPGISPWGARCFAIAALVAALALASFTGALRRAVPSAPRLRAVALGAAAGAWAGLAVFVFCPSGEQPHLLIGHVLPVFVATVAGAMGFARLLRP